MQLKLVAVAADYKFHYDICSVFFLCCGSFEQMNEKSRLFFDYYNKMLSCLLLIWTNQPNYSNDLIFTSNPNIWFIILHISYFFLCFSITFIHFCYFHTSYNTNNNQLDRTDAVTDLIYSNVMTIAVNSPNLLKNYRMRHSKIMANCPWIGHLTSIAINIWNCCGISHLYLNRN